MSDRRRSKPENPLNPRVLIRSDNNKTEYYQKKRLELDGEFPNMKHVFRDWERVFEIRLYRYIILNGKKSVLHWRMLVRGVRLPMTQELIQKYGGEGVKGVVWTRLYVDGASIPFLDPPLKINDVVFMGDDIAARIFALDRFGIDGSFVKLILVSDATDVRKNRSRRPKLPKDDEWSQMRDISSEELEAWTKKNFLDFFKKV